MNLQTETLAKQAAEYAIEFATQDQALYIPKLMEKFAELIIRECARIARATPCPYEDDEARQRLGHTWDMASIEAGRGIVKHFGVEE